MRRFELTGDFDGKITYTYRSDGVLIGINVNANLSDVAIKWVIQTAPHRVEGLDAMPWKNKTLKEL